MDCAPSEPTDDIERWFDAQGPLSRAFPHYRPRAAQTQMAQAVSRAITLRAGVVLEAGTGVGKTAAYLVPAMLHGGKVIVSTGTKTLQDQLYHRDIPALRDALALPVRVALLKGRANYVCHHHLQRAQTQGLLHSPQEVRDLRQVVQFAALDASGDRSRCSTVAEHASIWPKVTSTRDNCLGAQCGFFSQCFVLRARREAQDADVVVVNHHLFFADVMLREEGVSELLPQAQTVIFDEAHQLPHIAPLFFSQTVSSAQVIDWCRDVLAEGLSSARDAASWPQAIAPLERACRDARLAFAPLPQKVAAERLGAEHPLWAALRELRSQLDSLCALLDTQRARSPALAQLHHRGAELARALRSWQDEQASSPAPADEDHLHWVEVSRHHVAWLRTPLNVAAMFRRQRLGTAEQPAAPRAWVFTSATLSVKGDFSHFVGELGLDDCAQRSWPSPFDYPELAVLYVPPDLPEPAAADHTQALVQAALPLIRAARGRTFFLCTTHRALERTGQLLRQAFADGNDGLAVLQQNDAPRGELLRRFRDQPRSVLVGSHSFWEGVDVQGQGLSLVIIDKLPFAPPDDPLVAKRLERMARHDEQPFMRYQVPQAAIALKQGAGRLIRSETDRGVLMIGDVRLVRKPYGRRIWQSLPPMRRTQDEGEALVHLRSIGEHAQAADPSDAAVTGD